MEKFLREDASHQHNKRISLAGFCPRWNQSRFVGCDAFAAGLILSRELLMYPEEFLAFVQHADEAAETLRDPKGFFR
jgi:hypothetical protein